MSMGVEGRRMEGGREGMEGVRGCRDGGDTARLG